MAKEDKVEEQKEEKKTKKLQNNLNAEEKEIIARLQKGTLTVTEASELLDIPKEEVWKFIDNLRSKGYDIVIEKDRQVILRREPPPGKTIKLPGISSRTVKILVTSNWGYGLKRQQPSLVHRAFQIGEEEGVWFHLIIGNVCAGKPTPTKRDDYFLMTKEEQLDYLMKHIPSASFKSYFVNGPNELGFGGQRTIGEELAEARDDIKYYGDKKATFTIGEAIQITIMHIEGDPSLYTKSYALQGVMEGFQEAITPILTKEKQAPDILLLGGLHSALIIPPKLPLKRERENNFYGVAIPSLHAITLSQRAKKRRGVSPVLGCFIITLEFDEKGALKREPIFDLRDFNAYVKEEDYLEEARPKENLSEEEKKVLSLLNEKPRSWGELSRALKKSIAHAEIIVEQLKNQGYNIVWSAAEKRVKIAKGFREKFAPISLPMYHKSAKCAAVSDIHFGHIMSRPDLLPVVYQIAEERKVEKIYFCGDCFEGEGSYKMQRWELSLHGADQQRDYALKVWPKSEIIIEMVHGTSHETSFMEKSGHNILETFVRLAQAEKNLKVKYIGEEGVGNRGTSEINGINFQLFHPSGGIPYGISLRLQKLIESLVAVMETNNTQKVLLNGHLHVALFMMYKGMAGFFVPCLEEQTEYLASKGLIPWLGMWIIEVSMDKEENITRVVTEYIPFESKKVEQKKADEGSRNNNKSPNQ